jgi:hypothetical protein
VPRGIKTKSGQKIVIVFIIQQRVMLYGATDDLLKQKSKLAKLFTAWARVFFTFTLPRGNKDNSGVSEE